MLADASHPQTLCVGLLPFGARRRPILQRCADAFAMCFSYSPWRPRCSYVGIARRLRQQRHAAAYVPRTLRTGAKFAIMRLSRRNVRRCVMLDANDGETIPAKERPQRSQRWTVEDAWAAYRLPFNDLLFRSQSVHREHFDPNRVQLSRLLNIKTGGCPEDCGYCSQSSHHATALAASKLMEVGKIVAEARKAKDSGATRYCMGAAWRNPKPRDMDAIVEVVGAVKELGLETCMTLGMLDRDQADRLSAAGLDYYNHNIDTSERYYPSVISTRTFADRLDTLEHVREAGMKVCCGGILGMGESERDRVDMLVTLANLPEAPESVPINMLIPIPGTPMAKATPIGPIEFVRIVALARIMMPASFVRLSAGRSAMTDEMQALCFFAGANSIFVGDTLLTAGNPQDEADRKLFCRLGLEAL
ncbi:biotin synthase [Bradyrhizobium japonicum]|nr:biotin synthase [Bradyrhizobium japonicum]